MPTIMAAAAASPAGQSSQSGTRLSGAAGAEPAEVPDLAPRAGVAEPVSVALVPDDGAAGATARDPDVARADPAAPDLTDGGVVAAAVLVADLVLVVAGPVVAEPAVLPVPVLAVPPRFVPFPLVVGAVTCAAAGAASTRPSSRARRAGSIMAVT